MRKLADAGGIEWTRDERKDFRPLKTLALRRDQGQLHLIDEQVSADQIKIADKRVDVFQLAARNLKRNQKDKSSKADSGSRTQIYFQSGFSYRKNSKPQHVHYLASTSRSRHTPLPPTHGYNILQSNSQKRLQNLLKIKLKDPQSPALFRGHERFFKMNLPRFSSKLISARRIPKRESFLQQQGEEQRGMEARARVLLMTIEECRILLENGRCLQSQKTEQMESLLAHVTKYE